MSDDSQLLRRFAADRSEAAFGELVARHVSLVYSAALRQTGGDAHLAQDIAQLVFADLARKAAAISENVVLAGWLHRATIFAARQILRGERRRKLREQQAVTMNAIESENENGDWQQIRPLLDEALERLNKTDRDALLLRFFENQNLAQVGANLGGSEDAARKRIGRALEKLRANLSRHGVTTTATALSMAISANAMQVVPAGLAVTLTNASLVAAGTGTTFTLLKIMTATQLKLGISALVVAGAATAIVVQHQTQNKLRGENESLRRQIAQSQSDNENFSNRLAEIGGAKKLSDEQFNELLKLRGEVGVLRRQTNELGQLQEAVTNLMQSQSPKKSVSPQEQQRQTEIIKMSDAHQSGLACHMYAWDNSDQFPTNFDQVARYIGDTNLTRTLSNEFAIVYQGSQTNIVDPSTTIIIRENQAWQTYDGKWAKVYGFADGHSEVQVEPHDDFNAFESLHLVLPPTNGQ